MSELMQDKDMSPLEKCYYRVIEKEDYVKDTIADVKQVLEELKRDSERAAEKAKAKAGGKRRLQAAKHNLSHGHRQKCSEAFKKYDTNDSGYITVMELRKVLEEMHDRPVEEEEFTQVMKDFDTNRDGRMDFEEFMVCFAYTDQQRDQYFEAQMGKALNSEYKVGDSRMTSRVEGVTLKSLKRYLQKEIDETSSCMQFMWAAAIFCFFAISVSQHFRFDQTFAIDEAITWDVEQNANFAFSGIVPFENGRMGHKTMYDVNSIADFWSWFQMGLVPVFWPTGWDVSEVRANTQAECSGPKDALNNFGWPASRLGNKSDAPWNGSCPEGSNEVQWQQEVENFLGGQKVDGHYLLYFSIVGGVRLRQERVPSRDCATPYSKSAHVGKCIPDDLDYWLQPELRRVLDIDERFVNQAGGETQYLLSRTPQSEVREILTGLENRMWFSPSTRRVDILFTVYHPQLRAIAPIYIVFIMNEAGHILKDIEVIPFFLHQYRNPWLYFVDICWVLLLIKLFLEESRDVWRHLTKGGCIHGFAVYINLPNFVDWLSIVYAVVLIIFWATHLFDLAEIRQLMDQGQALEPGTWVDSGLRKEFFSLVDHTVRKTHLLRTLAAAYPFVIVSRFLKAFASQPRLAMVTNTLSKASVDIFHFGVVFFSVFTIFTMSALILWGGDSEYFATFPRAFNSVFRIMLGDFDWTELREIGRAQAYLWFWFFMWLVNLIMLNMLLAIVMDVYGDVKSGIGSAKTLWAQSFEILRRQWEVWKGRILSYAEILERVDPDFLDEEDDEDDAETVRPENLVQTHNLKEEQADEIIDEAYKLHEREAKQSDSADQLKKAARIETKVLQMHQFMNGMEASLRATYQQTQNPRHQNTASSQDDSVEI
mmetsp:Transcript_25161/g.49281  ORF Transcript_25161/g.49281 Transcript_25161/m.49281 type:complete len:878 (+) Transcript_25161:95-2728(+)